MNIIFCTGLIFLVHLSRVHGQDLSTQKNVLQVLCDVFPQICKDKSLKSSSLETPVQVNVNIHADIKIEMIKDKAPCELCEKIVHELNNAERNKEELIKTLDQFCDSLPDISRQKCEDFLEKYGDHIVEKMLADIPIDIVCQKIGLNCSIEADLSSAPCEICKKILNELINTKRNREELKKALEHVCHIFPHFIRHKCDDIVRKHGDQIVDMILNKVPFELICRRIGLCSPLEEKVSSVECEICKKVLNELINTKRNKEELKKALEHVCHIFPHLVRHKCDDFVRKYGDKIVDMILNKVPFELICRNIGLCSPIEEEVSFGPCKWCKEILNKLINTKRNKAELKRALNKVCRVFPHPIRGKCEKFVRKHGDQIVDMILNKVPFALICRRLGLCSTVEEDVSSVTCEICKKVLKELINTKRSRKELKRALAHVCDIFPRIVRNKCDKFVRQYGDKIVNQILNGVPFDLICQRIGLCSPSPVEEDAQFGLCKLCKKILNKVINTKRTRKELRKALERVCYIFPWPIRKQCKKIIRKYEDKIINLILEEVPIKEICRRIGLCFSIEDDVSSVAWQSENCTLCKLSTPSLMKIPGKKYTKMEIENSHQSVCFLMATSAATNCQYSRNKYFSPITVYFDQRPETPDEACQFLTKCLNEESELKDTLYYLPKFD